MKIQIITDSHSGMTRQEAEELGVLRLSMPFSLDGVEYLEDEAPEREEFFAKLSAGAEMSTSQSSPAEIMALWDRALETCDQVVFMPLSSGLSGATATALALAAEEPYTGRVLVVDSGRIATPLHLAVLDALDMVKQGLPAEEIRTRLENSRDDLTIYIAVQTLEYLKKGGRISPAAAAIGTLLNVKPILKLATGKLDAFRKCRGFGKARKAMLEAIQADLSGRFADAHARGEVRLMAATSASEEETEAWLAEIRETFPGMDILCDPLSLGVSCHTGEGALGIGLSCRP